jgi:hypothetical protein
VSEFSNRKFNESMNPYEDDQYVDLDGRISGCGRACFWLYLGRIPPGRAGTRASAGGGEAVEDSNCFAGRRWAA